MSTVCLDTSVLARWLLRQRRWGDVDRLVTAPGVEFVLPGPVLTETIVVVRANGNTSTPGQVANALTGLGMVVEPALTSDLVLAASLTELSRAYPGPGRGTRRGPTLSLADALILAVTRRLGCPVATSDGYWSWLAERTPLDVVVHRL